MDWVPYAGAAVASLGIVGYGVHRALLRAEQRGWIYYRNRRPPGVGLGLLTAIYQPSMEHVIEEAASERVRRDQEEAGEGGDEGSGTA